MGSKFKYAIGEWQGCGRKADCLADFGNCVSHGDVVLDPYMFLSFFLGCHGTHVPLPVSLWDQSNESFETISQDKSFLF